MPKVSVIIPNYNHALYLNQRIQSILNQTYQDFELIYLDDASTDNSNEVFAKFADDPRIRAIFNQTNSGSPFKQWNKGIRNASGEYIWIAESDDYADSSLLETLMQQLDQHPTAGIAYCQSWAVDAQDHRLCSLKESTANLDPDRWNQDFFTKGRDECNQYLIFQNTIPNASAVVFRKSIYEQVGGANESLRLSGDWMLWIKILMVSDLAFVAKPLNYFRKHINSVRSQSISSGLLLQEYLQLTGYILQQVTVSPKTVNAVMEDLINRWISSSNEYRWNWAFNLKIYRIFSKIDSDLNRRLVNRTLKKAAKILVPS